MKDRSLAPPRIAFVTTVYDGTGVGGATFVRYLRRAVEEGRLDLTFFSDEIAVPRHGCERKVEIPRAVAAFPGGWAVRAPFYHRAFLREHRRAPFDLLWHNNAITAVPALLAPPGIPVVGMVNDSSNATSRSFGPARRVHGTRRALARSAWRTLEGFSARRLHAVVANSRYLQGELIREYGLDPARVPLLYKGVALDQFPPRGDAPLSDPLRILFVKSNYVLGGLPELLRALAHFPLPVRLSVAGPAEPAFPHVRALAREAGYASGLDLLGRLGREEVRRELERHDVVCIPSRTEALGVTLLEALATGVPAVGPRVGGVPEVLDGGRAGWLVEPHEPRGLAATLLEVVRDGAARERRVQHGLEHVRSFSYEVMVGEMDRLARALRAGDTREAPRSSAPRVLLREQELSEC